MVIDANAIIVIFRQFVKQTAVPLLNAHPDTQSFADFIKHMDGENLVGIANSRV